MIFNVLDSLALPITQTKQNYNFKSQHGITWSTHFTFKNKSRGTITVFYKACGKNSGTMGPGVREHEYSCLYLLQFSLFAYKAKLVLLLTILLYVFC